MHENSSNRKRVERTSPAHAVDFGGMNAYLVCFRHLSVSCQVVKEYFDDTFSYTVGRDTQTDGRTFRDTSCSALYAQDRAAKN